MDWCRDVKDDGGGSRGMVLLGMVCVCGLGFYKDALAGFGPTDGSEGRKER